jgi:hypothetical protein
MRHYKTISEQITRTITDKLTCDICGKEIKEQYVGNYEFDQIKIERVRGSDYRDNKFQSTESYGDICSGCFIEKIEPFLELIGIKKTKFEY